MPLVGRKTLLTSFNDLLGIKRDTGMSAEKFLNGRSEFVGDAVQLRFMRLQQAQTRLYHLFIALILAALKLLSHKPFQGYVFEHDHILQRELCAIIAEGQVGCKPHLRGVRLCPRNEVMNLLAFRKLAVFISVRPQPLQYNSRAHAQGGLHDTAIYDRADLTLYKGHRTATHHAERDGQTSLMALAERYFRTQVAPAKRRGPPMPRSGATPVTISARDTANIIQGGL
jgi:hypothetical protein